MTVAVLAELLPSFAVWVPLSLAGALIGLGATAGWMLRGAVGR